VSSAADLVVLFAYTMFKGYIFLQFFYTVVKINFRSNTARGTTSRQCEVAWAMQVASEKGASSWLAVLHIPEHGFALHKGAF